MTYHDAFSWLSAHLGASKADSTVRRITIEPESIDEIVKGEFHASDPRRQVFRQCLRVILDEAGVKPKPATEPSGGWLI